MQKSVRTVDRILHGDEVFRSNAGKSVSDTVR